MLQAFLFVICVLPSHKTALLVPLVVLYFLVNHSSPCQFMLADCVEGTGRRVAPSMVKMCDWELGSAYGSQQIFLL